MVSYSSSILWNSPWNDRLISYDRNRSTFVLIKGTISDDRLRQFSNEYVCKHLNVTLAPLTGKNIACKLYLGFYRRNTNCSKQHIYYIYICARINPSLGSGRSNVMGQKLLKQDYNLKTSVGRGQRSVKHGWPVIQWLACVAEWCWFLRLNRVQLWCPVLATDDVYPYEHNDKNTAFGRFSRSKARDEKPRHPCGKKCLQT